MKKILLLLLITTSTLIFSEERRVSFSISSGTEYLEDFYFNTGVSAQFPMGVDKEFDAKVSLNIKTEENETGAVLPSVNLPITLGINFLFPLMEQVTIVSGVGIKTTMILPIDNDPDVVEELSFLVGPNVRLGLRYKIHPTMSLFIEADQSLLIGPPKWMYPATEILFGINFFI